MENCVALTEENLHLLCPLPVTMSPQTTHKAGSLEARSLLECHLSKLPHFKLQPLFLSYNEYSKPHSFVLLIYCHTTFHSLTDTAYTHTHSHSFFNVSSDGM